MISKWIKNALKDKAKEIISEGVDLGLEYLKNQLITDVYPTINYFNDVQSVLQNQCEELYIIENSVPDSTFYNKDKTGRYDVIWNYSDARPFSFDGIFKIKNTNLVFRFCRKKEKSDSELITKFTTFNLIKKDVEIKLDEAFKLYDKKYIRIEISEKGKSKGMLRYFDTFEKKYVQSLFYNMNTYTEQIRKHLLKNNSCVVLLYGVPGNQKSTYIKHLINELIIKNNFILNVDTIYVHTKIPDINLTGFHIIEDIDRLLLQNSLSNFNVADIELNDRKAETKSYFANLPEFLNNLDGSNSFLDETSKRLIIMTANDINNLPNALLNRRFDLQIRFDNPPKTKWLEILNTYLKPDYSNIVIEELHTLELSKSDNPFSVSLLLKLAKNLDFLEIENKEIFKNSVLVEYNKLNVI